MPPFKHLEPYLHVFVLTALVVAHPLLEILVQQPEFFVVHKWSHLAIWALPLGLVFLLPLPLIALRSILHSVSPTAGRKFDLALVVWALWLFSLQLAHPAITDLLGDHPSMLLALGAALLAGWSFAKHSAMRTFFTFLTPALLAVPLTFLLDPRIQSLDAEEAVVEPSDVEVEARFPIIFLLFDALSTTALVNREMEVNAHRFPHLADLASQSTWYPNATSISNWTTEAVPAMLTGKYPESDQLPRFADHPRNLFTLLHDSYRIIFSDDFVPLCPPQINSYPETVESPGKRLRSGIADLALVYLHRTFPPSYVGGLPAVDRGWGNFFDLDTENRPIPKFQAFLDILEDHPKPTLFFHHTLFPHMPYQVLPSGKIFQQSPSPFLALFDPKERRKPTLEEEIFLYKRYLFQAGYIDRMVGDLVARLKELDLYEESLIIITADHGGRTSPAHIKNDVFSIPLLLKLPHQKEPDVVWDAVSNLDLLPSLMDLLGIESSWSFDGKSFFSPGYQPPEKISFNRQLQSAELDLPANRQAMIEWKIAHFGLGEDPLQLFRAGAPHPEILGRPLNDFLKVAHEHSRVELDLAELDLEDSGFDYDPTSAFVPLLLRGSLFHETVEAEPLTVAVSINGTVEGTATARLLKPPDWYRFKLTVPETAFQKGRNEVRVWLVDHEDPQVLLSLAQ